MGSGRARPACDAPEHHCGCPGCLCCHPGSVLAQGCLPVNAVDCLLNMASPSPWHTEVTLNMHPRVSSAFHTCMVCFHPASLPLLHFFCVISESIIENPSACFQRAHPFRYWHPVVLLVPQLRSASHKSMLAPSPFICYLCTSPRRESALFDCSSTLPATEVKPQSQVEQRQAPCRKGLGKECLHRCAS